MQIPTENSDSGKSVIFNFIKKYKFPILLSLIIFIGAYLRLSEFHNLLRFNADQVRDAQVVNTMFEKNDFPLLGPKAGGTGFKLGPAFYYMEYFSGLIFGNTPSGIAVFVPLLAIFSIPLFFYFLKLYFPSRISIALTFLYAVSFYATRYSRFAWNPNAIFFFLFLFLISLYKIIDENGQKFNRWHFLLAISVGIGIQLHTILLFLMPVLMVAAYIYIALIKRKIWISSFFAILAIILALISPFIAHDFIHSGSNLRSFFEGTQKKTEKNNSIFGNIINSGQFFVQGNLYSFSGFEPQKNWTNGKKLLASHDFKEISAAAIGTAFFIFGFVFMVYSFWKETDEKKKKFIGLIAAFFLASIILFIPLANELNLRFFVVLVFLPFIFLGILMNTLEKWIGKKYAYPIFIILLSAITVLNLFYYHKTYNLENYTARSSAYGGISLGETERISKFILNLSRDDLAENKKIYLLPFGFEKSLDFINQKSGADMEDFSDKKIEDGAIVFLIAEKEQAEKVLDKQSSLFLPISREDIGRFAVLALHYKKPDRVGFIVDIHAKRGGAKKNFVLNQETKGTLEYFVNHMNDDFQPDFVVQGGDFIDGTKRWGQESIDDFNLLTSYFKNLQMPFYHVIGNHEMRGFSKEEWFNFIGQEKSYYYFDREELRVIVLDGDENENIREDEAELESAHFLSEDQLQWIEKVISEKNELRKIVFIHYPIVNKNITPGDKIIEAGQAERLQKMFSENNVAAVFSGHVEKLEMDTIGGVDYFIIPGLERSENKDVLWLDAFADITIGNRAKVDFYYKKDSTHAYKTLEVPSEEFEKIEK